jgi:hypothetical protein
MTFRALLLRPSGRGEERPELGGASYMVSRGRRFNHTKE